MRDPGPLARAVLATEPLAGLRSQALGLAEAAGLETELFALAPRRPWGALPARFWPDPVSVLGFPRPAPPLLIGCGGMAAALGAALRGPDTRAVQIQNPRMRLDRFDLVVANRHDGIAGPNVVVTRTALHRATPARLRTEALAWGARLAHLPRPLVAVLVGGGNGRFRLGAPEAAHLAAGLARMMRYDGAGLALTPSRRTAPAALAVLRDTLAPLGAWIWDGAGDNPYFGLLGLADAVVATVDSVSMASEAAATAAPLLLAPLPGRSRRIRLFAEGLVADGRARWFEDRLARWPVAPLDDTPMAAEAMRRRLGL